MSLLLNWRLWLAIAMAAGLAVSHFTAYRKGKQNVRNEWTLSVAEANADARRMETLRQSRVDEAARAAAGRVAVLRRDAANARRQSDGLRDDLRAARERGAQSLEASRQHSATLEAVLGQCVRQLEEVARDADGHASDSLNYQEAWPTDNP